jgi:pheromone shutdown protein TraB
MAEARTHYADRIQVGVGCGQIVTEPDSVQLGRVTLIGTGHVFSIEETVREAIIALRPDVVFIELDRGRLMALLHRRKTGEMPPSQGGFIHKKLAAFQEQIATRYGSDPGAEMIGAYEGARAIGARVALIDQGADKTIGRALKQMTWKERAKAVGYMFGGVFKRGNQATLDDQIRQYQENSLGALAELKGKFPTIYRVVIQERDELMAARIRVAMHEAKVGVAVVGDGHVPGMSEILADVLDHAYRLEAVRAGRLPKPMAQPEFSFTFTSEGSLPAANPPAHAAAPAGEAAPGKVEPNPDEPPQSS